MADPITPAERTWRLALARRIIQQGGPEGLLDWDTGRLIIDAAEHAVLQNESLAREIEKLCGRILKIKLQVYDEVRMVKRLRVGLVVIQDIAVTTISNQFLNEAGAKAALREILAVIEGVTK